VLERFEKGLEVRRRQVAHVADAEGFVLEPAVARRQ
jgi:hypothetical protein